MESLQQTLSSLDLQNDYDPDSMPVEQARKLIRQFLTPLTEQESLPLHAALHRTLAADVLSPINVPPHDYSAMDGYAMRYADLENNGATFKIAGKAYAGHPFAGAVQDGECVRIMTGALIPDGCDCVVMQEQVVLDGDTISLPLAMRRGQNIRRVGEDMLQNSTVLMRGKLICPAEMGLLASLGLNEVSVYRKLRVAIFSTGDELQQPGSPLARGQIYDSNRYSLRGLLSEAGIEILDKGNIHDDKASLKAAFTEAAQQADVVITSGGVSVGEADYVKQLLAEIGEVVFWKIAMKPGRPFAFGKLSADGNHRACHFFGLPGNPVAVMVTFQQLVHDALRVLMGQQSKPTFTFKVTCVSAIKKTPGRTEFQRGILSQDENGGWTVCTTGEQGSGILSSMSKANCFIVLPDTQGNSVPGAMVDVQLF